MSYAMTRMQKRCYDFIAYRLREAGVPPSFQEMNDHLGLRSKSGVHRLITALEERGKIVRLPNRARSITLADDNLFLRLPAELTSELREASLAFGLSVPDLVTRAVVHWLASAALAPRETRFPVTSAAINPKSSGGTCSGGE